MASTTHKALEEFDNLVRELMNPGTTIGAKKRVKSKKRNRANTVVEERKVEKWAVTERMPLPFAINALAKRNLLLTVDISVLKEALRPIFRRITTTQLEALESYLNPAQTERLREIWKLLAGEKVNGKHNP